MSLIFPLVLHKKHYAGGFFNLRVAFDKHIAADGSAIEIRMPDCGRVIEGKVNRRAQDNGTARIMGGVPLRDCFQTAFDELEQVNLHILSPTVLEIKRRPK